MRLQLVWIESGWYNVDVRTNMKVKLGMHFNHSTIREIQIYFRSCMAITRAEGSES